MTTREYFIGIFLQQHLKKGEKLTDEAMDRFVRNAIERADKTLKMIKNK